MFNAFSPFNFSEISCADPGNSRLLNGVMYPDPASAVSIPCLSHKQNKWIRFNLIFSFSRDDVHAAKNNGFYHYKLNLIKYKNLLTE